MVGRYVDDVGHVCWRIWVKIGRVGYERDVSDISSLIWTYDSCRSGRSWDGFVISQQQTHKPTP